MRIVAYLSRRRREINISIARISGAMGSIRSLDCEKMGKIEVDGKLLKVYKVNAIDPDTDMEHE